MRGLLIGGAIVVALVVVVPLTSWMVVLGARPDPVLLVIIATGLVAGSDLGLRAGFAGGLLVDLSAADGLIGVGALVGLATGLAAGQLRVYASDQPFGIGVAIAAGLSAGAALVGGFLDALLGQTLALSGVLTGAVGLALTHAILAGPIIALVRRLVRRADRMTTG